MTWSDLIAPTAVHRLDSGARLVVMDRPGLRNAICLSHVRGGSRSDPRGAAGTAHLTEHLLVQGLAPDGERWVTPVVAAGGDLGATTHPDYLEFCFEGPPAALRTGLAAERVRLTAWPHLRDGELTKQRDGVCREIEQHVARPTRSLPWPDLGIRIFGTWADGHDPFGEVEHVRALDVEACAAFFRRHHHPESSVVVILADLRTIDVETDIVAQLQPEMTARCDRTPAEPDAPPDVAVDHDGIVTGADWSTPTSVGALGWRTSAVMDDPQTYAGLLAIATYTARLVNGQGRLGQMVPMDRLGEDALTVTVTHPQDARAQLEEAQRHVDALAQGRTPHPAALDGALRQARAETAATIGRPRGAAQLIARSALLAGDPYAAGAWVDAVQRVDAAGVHAAAARLVQAPVVGIVRRPHRARTAIATAAPTRAGATLRPLTIDRPTLTASICARLPHLPASEAARLRAGGHRVVKDAVGWLVSRTIDGRADDLAEETAAAVSSLPVSHVTVVGAHASKTETWVVPAPETPTSPAPDRGLELLPPEGLPAEMAGAHLRWPVGTHGVLPRWLGVALLADIQARSHGADPHPLAAPPHAMLSLRQEAIPGDRTLVFEVWAASDHLPDGMRHLAAELGPDRLRERARGVSDTAVSLAGQWLRDECDGPTLARRAASLLDLGATDEDVLHFPDRLQHIDADTVVNRLLQDTAAAPHGWIRTHRPELLDDSPLPWLTACR